MNLPAPPQFRGEDFAEAPSWAQRLLELLTAAFRTLHASLASVPEDAEVVDRGFTTESSGNKYVDLESPFARKVRHVIVTKLAREDGDAIADVWSSTWAMADGRVRILFVGLTASTKYKFSAVLR